MRIDILPADTWGAVSAKCRAGLPFQDPNVIVQAYMGLPHALFEATHGLARLFSHKKTIAFVGHSEPFVEAISNGFMEEGYHVKRVSEDEAADPSAAWLAPILNDLIFVVFSTDDPITGRLFNRDPINEALKDKRIFRISIVHTPRYLSHALSRPAPFKLRLLSHSQGLATIVAGERFRVHPLLASRLPWPIDTVVPDMALIPPEEIERQKSAILAFETKLPWGFKPYFKAGELRVFDRAVIFHERIDGSALAEVLAGDRGVKLAGLGLPAMLESTSPCRWSDVRFTDWLLARGEREEVVRGLLLVDPWLIDSSLTTFLSDAAAKLLKMQAGS